MASTPDSPSPAQAQEDMSITHLSNTSNSHHHQNNHPTGNPQPFEPYDHFETGTVSASQGPPRPPTNQRPPSPHSPHHHRPDLADYQTTGVASHTYPVTHSSPSAASTPRSSIHNIKRKPLSSSASAFALRFSQGSGSAAPSPIELPRPDHRFSRTGSVDSPILYEYPASIKTTNIRPA